MSRLALALLVVGLGTRGASGGGLLNPVNFDSLGTPSFTAGVYVVDSDLLEIRRFDGAGPVWTGVLCDGVAVWAFDDLVIPEAAFLSCVGLRSISMLSRGDMSIDGVVDASGSIAIAGPGGWSQGQGPGAGDVATGSSGGGGFGGTGGDGGPMVSWWQGQAFTWDGGAGGGVYGDLTCDLVGGSGGGLHSGGGGGGALQLAAAGKLTINGLVDVSGGEGAHLGGGGAGGGVLLSAKVVELATDRAVIDASGGVGASSLRLDSNTYLMGGGGGGGGVVQLHADLVLAGSLSIDVSGGDGWTSGQSGVVRLSAVPEPSTVVMAALAAIPVGLVVRRRARSW